MILNQTIKNWKDLLAELRINENNIQSEDSSRLVQWCQKNVKSSLVKKDLNSIRTLFEAYMELNSQEKLTSIVDNDLKYNVIHKAAKFGFDCFIDKCLFQISEDKEKRQFLDQRSKNGNTSLHLAALHGHIECLDVLLDNQADPNAFNNDHRLPLILTAMRSMPSNIRCAKLLLNQTDINKLKTKDNTNTPLFLSLINLKDVSIIKELVSKEPDFLKIRDERGQNVLHLAIINKDEALVNYLLNYSALVKTITANNSTALHLVCRYGSERMISSFLACLDYDPNYLNIQDEHRYTALHYLAEKGHNELLINRVIALGACTPEMSIVHKTMP